jgi:UDP-N-acetylmuramoylalanine--D-glutamate ligase
VGEGAVAGRIARTGDGMNPDKDLVLSGRRVLVWGFGSHGGGLAAARYCSSAGAVVSILDLKRPEELGAAGAEAVQRQWAWHTGDSSHAAFSAADLVVVSPAIPPRAWPILHPPVTSPEALFCAAHRGPRIAVSGTKGKSTTAHLCASLLGWTVTGNSNEPLLEVLMRVGTEVPVVCELSSFQLHYLAPHAPRFHATVFTSLARDHLDWHPDLAHYHASKLRLLEWADSCIVAPELAHLVPSTCRQLPAVTYRDGVFMAPGGRRVASRGDLRLLGEHNARNACLALSVALIFGSGEVLTSPGARLRTIRALPHRLELVHAARGMRFVNDSIATTPEAAAAGLAAIEGPLAIILGGSDKGADFRELAGEVAMRGAWPITIGQTGETIARLLAEHGITAGRADSLDEAIRLCLFALQGGGTVLLSPACASFDMFNGYEDRGRRFAEAARRQCPGGTAQQAPGP